MNRHLATSLSLFTLVCTAHPLHGDSPADNNSPIWKVEEKWEARIDEPDEGLAAPHITTTLCAQGNGDGQHAIININHVTLDYFQPGGVQIQVWNGEQPLTHDRVPWQNVLATQNEVVTWTQSMTHTGNKIVYRITDGHSATWGNFGGQGFLTAQVNTSLPNLNQYDPAYSLSNSGVVYASNRVNSLILKSIRMYSADGEVYDIPVNVDVLLQQQYD